MHALLTGPVPAVTTFELNTSFWIVLAVVAVLLLGFSLRKRQP